MSVFKIVLTARISTCGGRMYCSCYSSSVPWDDNWDKRKPETLVMPCRGPDDEIRYLTDVVNATPFATRKIILVRHGQYNHDGKTDAEKNLTQLGKDQARVTGIRLQELGMTFSLMTVSTMFRAKETADIIREYLPSDLKVEYCILLEEGAPVLPDPPPYKKHMPYLYYRDGPRIEAGFRKFFHRADVSQSNDSVEIIVLHANVIRYFVCRALQFPGDAWLRMSLHNACLSTLTILPSGRVVLESLGDSGYLPPQFLTQ